MKKIKITQIDHYAFNGRERHPDDKHIGQVGIVLKTWMEAMSGGYCGGEDDASLRLLAQEILDEPEFSYMVLVVYLPETREILEMIEHEVEWIS